jgi:hypothetical protein
MPDCRSEGVFESGHLEEFRYHRGFVAVHVDGNAEQLVPEQAGDVGRHDQLLHLFLVRAAFM